MGVNRRHPWIEPALAALFFFLLISAFVSWPWHDPGGTRSDLVDITTHDQAAQDRHFCLAMGLVRTTSERALDAVRAGDYDDLVRATDRLDAAVTNAGTIPQDVPVVKDYGSLRTTQRLIRDEMRAADGQIPRTASFRSSLRTLAQGAEHEAKLAGCSS
jgi:hypothetical protein